MSDGEQTLKMSVIGVGALGRHHARILSQMDGVNVVAVCDPNESQGRAVAEEHGLCYLRDYREVLDRVDAVSVVVPTFLHRQVAEDCFAAGVAVMMEKPLAGTLDDGSAIVAMGRRAGLTLGVGHVERFNPTFESLCEHVALPRYIRAERLSPYAFRSTDISAVHDLMVHDIELCQHLAGGRVSRVDALGTSLVGELPDAVQARLRFENGCVADLVANRVSPEVKRSMQVWSEAGCATADLQSRTLTVHRPGPRLAAGRTPLAAMREGEDVAELKASMFDGFYQTLRPAIGEGDALTAELRSFVDAVRTGEPPRVSGEDGLAALAVADRVVADVEAHRWDRDGAVGPLAHPLVRPPMRAAA